jgi:uncharacterized membrane protein
VLSYTIMKTLHIVSMCVWFGVDLGVHASMRLASKASLAPVTRREFLRMRRVLDFGPQLAMMATVPIGVSLTRLGSYRFGSMSVWLLGLPLLLAAVVWAFMLMTGPSDSGLSPQPVRGALRTVDVVLRVAVIIGFVGIAIVRWPRSSEYLTWLHIKMLLFALVVACGLWIRMQLGRVAASSDQILSVGDPAGVSEEAWNGIAQCYARCRVPVVLSWIAIVAAVVVGTGKPI